MRTLPFAILSIAVLHAQPAASGDLQKIENVCSAEDAEAVGLDCSEDRPCPVYLELVAADGFGSSVFVSGNLHTSDTTIYGLLLASTDAGKTWTEPVKRIRASALGQVQFIDQQHGWVAGMLLDPLPRSPFLLSTVNGGEMWHRTPLSSDFGSIEQFWFDSDARGEAVVDRSQGKNKKYDLLTSSDGGESWSLKSSSEQEIRLPEARPPDQANWRATADKDEYRIERRTSNGWETLAKFPIHAGECK